MYKRVSSWFGSGEPGAGILHRHPDPPLPPLPQLMQLRPLQQQQKPQPLPRNPSLV